MAVIVDMPKLSDTMTTGTLAKWLKNEGDPVAPGDMIAEVETDKATMELENFEEGILLKQYATEGQEVVIGAPICAIGEKGESAPDAPTGKAQEASATTTAKDVPIKQPTPAAQQPIVTEEKVEGSEPTPVVTPNTTGRIKASPLAKKIATEKGIDLTTILGSGPEVRIIKVDVLGASPSAKTSPSTGIHERIPAAAQATGQYIEQPVTKMRKIIAERLLESKTQVPHFYLEIEVDALPMIQLRAQLNKSLAELPEDKGGIKFTVNDFILKATAEALRRVPEVNASWLGDRIKQYGSVDLAFGVSVDEGLVTPVIRSSESKSLRSISLEAKELIVKARQKKLTPNEMTGSTFTVTNLGMFGISSFYGIINPPNAAILSIGATIKKPVVLEDDTIGIGHRMLLGLSGDHRVIDGANAAKFLNELKVLLETPTIMLV